jgi:hypothetical protein
MKIVLTVEKLLSIARIRLISEKRLVLFLLLMCVDFSLPGCLNASLKAITWKKHRAHIRLQQLIVSITTINVKFSLLISVILPTHSFIPTICGW